MSASGDRPHILILGLMGLAACAGGATAVHKGGEAPAAPARAMAVPPPDAPTPASAKDESSVITVDADTPMTTPSGATTIVPKGWTATTEGKVVLLQDPNREVSLRLVERKEVDGVAARKERGGKTVLELQDGQQKVVFERQP